MMHDQQDSLVFKNFLKVGTTFLLLLGGYFGYVRAFDMVVHQFESERLDDSVMFPPHTPKSKKDAHDLAELTFGRDHWTVTTDLPYAYYNSQQGYWMYWQNYEEIKEEDGVRYDGKRVRMWPFAMIGKSANGKNIWRLTADRATLDMNRPIGLGGKDSEGTKVEHAYIEGDVRIRDDRATPSIVLDDLNIGPLTYLDYDDATRVIKTESHVIIVDPDQTTVGDGLFIQLRKPDLALAATQGSSSSGFSGVEYAILQKNPRVTLRDVGNSGFLPSSATQPAPSGKTGASAKTVDVVADGTAKAAGTKDAPSPASAEPMPLDIRSQGLMRVDLPPDRLPVAVGPPAPPAPTLVRFERNVVALHGRLDDEPNQLNCDTLRLTLIPGAPPPPTGRDKGKAGDNPGSNENTAAKSGSVEPSAAPTSPEQADQPRVASADNGTPPTASPSGGPQKGLDSGPTPGGNSSQSPPSGSPSNESLFGNLTLKKAHATGHAVWLQLRKQAAKVRCIEMIHERNMPYWPDSTFFRGDATRQVWLEKIDYEQEEENKDGANGNLTSTASSDPSTKAPRTVKSVTHVTTLSAKLFDRGNGLDLADVRAFGPGRLESRPALTEPVERIAVWQDELTIVNVVGVDGKLAQKQVTLTGARPFFVDVMKKTSLDSGQEIKVFLKPRTSTPAGQTSVTMAQTGTDGSVTTHSAAKPTGAALAGDAFATGPENPARDGSASSGNDASLTSGLGGSLQIERLLAYRDVHFVAPNRRMEARVWLDAPFIEVDPPPVTESSSEAKTEGSAANSPVAEAPPSPGPADPSTKADNPKVEEPKAEAPGAAKDAEPQTPDEPAMTGVADRIVAKVALPRGKALDGGKSSRRAKSAPRTQAPSPDPDATDEIEESAAAAQPTSESKEAEADIREAWLRGNVSLHQDKAPDPDKKDQPKPKGNDITGEAVYFDNQGKAKVKARVYHRDPTNPVPLPGPIHWARVSNDDKIVYGEVIWMDQEKDKVWAYGPGVLSQWTDRALFTDKAPESKPAEEGAGSPTPTTAAGTPAAGTVPSQRASTSSRSVPVRVAGESNADGDRGAASSPAPGADGARAPATPPKPRTRAGKPVGDKDLMFITWTKNMEFTGRTTDTAGRPAGRADFYGTVDAWMTDARLHCEQKMIVFTDREVPLGQIGSAMGGPGKRANSDRERPNLPEGDENAEREAPENSRVDISLIYCFGNPVAISRKVDPDFPTTLEYDRVDAWDYYKDPTRPDDRSIVLGRLDYNRRTGEFFVPGPGIVYLYDRPDEKPQKDGQVTATGAVASSDNPAGGGQRPAGTTAVTPTSARSSNRGDATPRTASRGAAGPQQRAVAATPPVKRTIPPLVLMQVKFNSGMKGRVGAGQANDTKQERWSEFFGNIEFIRSKVASENVVLNPDQRLSDDGFYLTSQMLRVIQEPPPPGSPEKSPSHSYAKAWDKVHVNKGEDFAIESDIATFDSGTDLIWAYGEGGRGVTLAQQRGPGQPISPSYARAVQYNVKTHAWRQVDGSTLNLIDYKTGVRPTPAGLPDPTAQPKKRVKQPFKVPNTNLERRGFTGY
jgi:hypothetical protein